MAALPLPPQSRYHGLYLVTRYGKRVDGVDERSEKWGPSQLQTLSETFQEMLKVMEDGGTRWES